MTSAAEAAGGARPPAIPGYRIEGVLGRGATGVVYRAVQLSIGRVVALKVLHPGSVRNVRVVRRLQREARTAARLTHPNIISAIDMGRADDTWWFAMELVEGPSLAERLEHGGRLSERKALSIFIPLCDALQHASERGVVHRDVKPANILLEHDDRPRLVDLGLARVEDDPQLTRTGATLGTPHYISPEQARDPATVDVRSDIWSLGATLFHAVCGRPPFTGESAAELLSGVLYGGIPDPRELRPDLSKGLALVLRKCLSRDPDRRYFTPGEMRQDLERVRDHKAPAIKTSALEPLGTQLTRERRNWTIAGASLIGAILVALVLWRPWSSGNSGAGAENGGDETWPRFDQLANELREGTILLAAAWLEREELCPHAPPSYVTRCRELQAQLYNSLATALWAAQKRAGEELGALLRDHEFERGADLLDRVVLERLYAETGFRVEALPARLASGFQAVLDQQRALLERTRAAALESVVATTQGYVDNVLAPRLRTLEEAADFERAIALLDRGRAELLAEAGADARGLDAAALDERLRQLETDIETEIYGLRQEQRRLDDELFRWVDRAAGAYEERLRARELLSASEAFASGFEQELARYGLARERMSGAGNGRPLEWRTLPRFEQRHAALVALERELLAADAEKRFEELEAEARDLWPAREYEGAAEFWRAKREDALLAPVLRLVDLRIDEAQELVAFLHSAAAGVRALDGQAFGFVVSTLEHSGTIEVGHDPLREGFQLVPKSGQRGRYRLRKSTVGGGTVLDAKAVERFAEQGAVEPQSPEFALRRALFRYHEGNLEGAREVLDSSALSADDFLVYDLGLRLQKGIVREESLRAESERFALELFGRLTERKVEGDPAKVVRSIDDLLQRHAEFLDADQLTTLRELKQKLGAGPPPSTIEEFRREFAPDAVEFVRDDSVVLRYEFDGPTAGTWQPGEWHCDGIGWVRAGLVPNDGQLVREDSPRLLLVDPFVVGDDPLEVRVTFEQPSDSPPNLLVVSAFGCHAVFDAGGPRCGPHWLVDTQELEGVVARARDCEGASFAGFEPGKRHVVLLRVQPDSGRLFVAVDERELGYQIRARAGSKGSRSVSIRSVEPVRLLAVEIQGTRR